MEHLSSKTVCECPVNPDYRCNVNDQAMHAHCPPEDRNHSCHISKSFQKIEGQLRTLQIGATAGTQRSLNDGRSMAAVLRPTSLLERYGEPEFQTAGQLQEASSRIQTLFAEIIKELSDHIQDCGSMERFPQMEEYGRKRTFCGENTLVCRLCREELQGSVRWHFESRHYDRFLDWLDEKAMKSMRKRRVRLVHHLHKRQSQN